MSTRASIFQQRRGALREGLFLPMEFEEAVLNPAVPFPLAPPEGQPGVPGLALFTAQEKKMERPVLLNTLRNLVNWRKGPVLCVLTRCTERELMEGLYTLETGSSLASVDGAQRLEEYRRAGKPLEKYEDALLYPGDFFLTPASLGRFCRVREGEKPCAVVMDDLFLFPGHGKSGLYDLMKELKAVSTAQGVPLFLLLPPALLAACSQAWDFLDCAWRVERHGSTVTANPVKPAGFPELTFSFEPATGALERLS